MTFREGVALHRGGDFEAAAARYRRVLAAAPDLVIAKDNLCQALLALGRYREGFALYDVRCERNARRVEKPALSFPEWRGEPLRDRSILVWPEQGYGDQIMFARFAATLARAGATVSMLVPPPLVRLFAQLPVRVLAAEGSVSIPRHDFWALAGSLPGRLGVDLAGLPARPYLPAAPRPGSGIGIAWRGDPRHHNDAQRSLPAALAQDLLALPGARSLHPEDTGARDFQDTASLIDGLSLVVSVDTSVAHLAGAMGKPTWVLIPAANADWRWMGRRDDSPWYPSMRLWRQPTPGDWTSVITEICARLS